MAKKKPKPYPKGRRLEYKVRDFFERLGFYVVRSAGSKGDFDLIAIRDGTCIGIQVKSGNKLPPESLRILSRQLGIKTMFITVVKGTMAHMYTFNPDGKESIMELRLR